MVHCGAFSRAYLEKQNPAGVVLWCFVLLCHIGYTLVVAGCFYTRYERQKLSALQSPARVHTQKKGQNKVDSGGAVVFLLCCGVFVVLWCFCCAVVLLFVPFLANQKQRSQAQLAVVVGKNRVLVATTRVDRERRRRSTARVRQCGYVFR